MARRAALVGSDTLIAGIDLAKRESVVVFIRAKDKARLGKLRIPTTREGVAELERRGRLMMEREGLTRLVLGMEPTDHYWKVVCRAGERLGIGYAIVQSFVVARARELDDLTRDKTDHRDAALIADLVADLRFTDVRLESGAWLALRSYADARARYRVERASALQEQRSLLELAWPELLRVVLDLRGCHLQAALRLGLTPSEIARIPLHRFTSRLRIKQRAHRFSPEMSRRIWEAARAAREEPEAVSAALRWQLAGERAQAAELAISRLDVRMREAFAATGLDWMRGQIRGLGEILLTNLLAFSGDPRRLDDAACMLKLAGSNPTERSSGEQVAAGGIHRRGRPSLRLLAFQAATCLLRHNPEFQIRYRALVDRARHPLSPKQAQLAVANKLLRVLWSMAVSGRPYDSQLAAGGLRQAA
ncbi:MAG: IS110 family transposase [Pseudonocardiales bacterium]|nr:MAG: IS110 family transposase [Pseudonocardiales bacterium]